jgi:hypothetical protein
MASKNCIDCAEGFHQLCAVGNCIECHGPSSAEDFEELAARSGGVTAVPDLVSDDPSEMELPGSAKKKKSRKGQQLDPDRPRAPGRKKTDAELKDPKSTGRHRAVKLHGHADRTAPCEWRGLANCGGGRFPILGCVDGVQESLHHGPDKSTLNNERVNIHKICYGCHNRWHTLNDVDYQWDGIHEHHSPREVTPDDVIASALFWANRQVNKAREE